MPTEDSSDWRDPRMASLTDQQLLAVMTSFMNLGVDLSPLCKNFCVFISCKFSYCFPFFQFLRDVVPLKSQRRGCVLIWVYRSCTRTLSRLPTHQRSSRHLSQGFVLDCHDYVTSGLPLHPHKRFRGFSLFENSFIGHNKDRSLWYPVPYRHRPWVSPQSLSF